MITDKITNFIRYSKIFPEVFEIISENDLFLFQTGRHTIDEQIYMLATRYETILQPKTQYENHHKYIDVQLLLQGVEDIAYTETSTLNKVKSYDQDQDYELFEGDGNILTLHNGYFAIFFPGEAHQPGIANRNTISSNHKVIFKLKASSYAQ